MTDAEIRDVRSIPSLWGDTTKPTHSQALDLQGIKSHTWRIMPCSAVTGFNLIEGLDWVVDEVAGRLYYSSTIDSAGLGTAPLAGVQGSPLVMR
jgi:hypothetical protein